MDIFMINVQDDNPCHSLAEKWSKGVLRYAIQVWQKKNTHR